MTAPVGALPVPLSIRDLLVRRLGAPVSSTADRTLVTTAVTVIAKQDAARAEILIVNQGAFIVFVAPAGSDALLANTQGIRLEANGGSVALLWEEDGEQVAYQWSAIAVGGATFVWVQQTLIDQGAGRT